MKQFTRADYFLLTQLLSYNQEELKNNLFNILKKYQYTKIKNTEDFLIAEGTIPIALVAHLDTVFESKSRFQTLLYDSKKQVLIDPFLGAGFDDRAGVFAILEILKADLRPHIIFTTNEELGGLGAESLASEPCPFEDLRYIIELDRQGNNDCVFYNCESEIFQKYIENFGFKTAIGSFSDISTLCPSWQICGVNLSIGYYNEHSNREILFLNSMYTTISRVIKMLKSKDIPNFIWEGITYVPQTKWWEAYLKHMPSMQTACKHCHKPLVDQEGIGAINEHGGIAYYCFDCMPHFVSYCPRCGEPFENSEGIASEKFCPDCKVIMGGDTYDTFKF